MKRFFSLITTTGLLAAAAQAAIFVSAEAPGVQNTTQSGTYTVETFDAPGVPTPGQAFPGSYVSPVGTYSAGAAVVGPNDFGGAFQSNYISIGAQQPSSLSYTLSFSAPAFYFGFYWGAGDPQNQIEFFDGATSLGSYRIADLISSLGLGPAYNGNPNLPAVGAPHTPGIVNPGEKYVFFNFNATGSTQFTSILFSNDSTSTGFETDNHTVGFDAPPVPEPATFALAGLSLAVLGFKFRKRS